MQPAIGPYRWKDLVPGICDVPSASIGGKVSEEEALPTLLVLQARGIPGEVAGHTSASLGSPPPGPGSSPGSPLPGVISTLPPPDGSAGGQGIPMLEGDVLYANTFDGRRCLSTNGGRSWSSPQQNRAMMKAVTELLLSGGEALVREPLRG